MSLTKAVLLSLSLLLPPLCVQRTPSAWVG